MKDYYNLWRFFGQYIKISWFSLHHLLIAGSWREHEGLGSCGGKSAREGGEVQRTGAKFLDHILHISEEQDFPVHILFVSDLDSSQPTKDR